MRGDPTPAGYGRRRRPLLAGIAGFATVSAAAPAAVAAPSFWDFHHYYIPSEAMMPTLVKYDRIAAVSDTEQPFTRGEVILFRTRSGDTYIKRVAGLPGDRIALSGGRVVLNGATIRQQLLGSDADGCLGSFPHRPARLSERLPGEAQPHQIYDCGPSPEDDFPEQVVAAGHLFVLGDNRDNSADSRVAPELGGVAQVAIGDVVGRFPVYTLARGRRFWEHVR